MILNNYIESNWLGTVFDHKVNFYYAFYDIQGVFDTVTQALIKLYVY